MKGIADWNDTSMTAGLAASRVPVLVQFTARWCPPCNAMKPGLARLAARLEGSLVVAQVDVDESPDLAVRHGVRGVPTLVIFRGVDAIARKVGASSAGALEAWVASSL
jgi:thioredoxin 1